RAVAGSVGHGADRRPRPAARLVPRTCAKPAAAGAGARGRQRRVQAVPTRSRGRRAGRVGAQPNSRASILAPPVQTPIAVPREVRKKLTTTRATRLRHQPRTLFTSARRAMKSAWVGLRTQASINALTVPEASAGCSGVNGEETKAPRMLSGCPPATRQPSAPNPPVHSAQYSSRSAPTAKPPLAKP